MMFQNHGVTYLINILKESEHMGDYSVKLGSMDFLTKQAQNEVVEQNSGTVKIYSILNNIHNIKTLVELENMPYERARKHILSAKQFHSTKRLIQYWHTNSTFVYQKLFPKYDIPKVKFIPGLIRDANGNEIPKKKKRFNARIEKKLNAEELSEQLIKLASMVKECSFYVNIKIEELTNV